MAAAAFDWSEFDAVQSGRVIPPAGGEPVPAKTLVGRAVLCPDCATGARPQTAEVVDGGWACQACGSTGTATDLLGNPRAVLRAGSSSDCDDAGMPWIIPPGGGTPVRYARASSFAKSLEDAYLLHRRDLRAQAVGFAAAANLLLEVDGVARKGSDVALIDELTTEQGRELDRVVWAAMREGGVWEKTDRGTLLHSIGEHRDLGKDVPESIAKPDVLAQYEPWLAARDACLKAHEVVWLARELTVVNDDLQAAGALDGLAVMRLPYDERVPSHLRGRFVIVVVDDKYGQLGFALLSYTAQQAIYAGGRVYNPGTGSRVTLAEFAARRLAELSLDVDVEFTEEVAVILNTPLDDDPVTHFVPVPLEQGRTCARAAVAIRELRSAATHWLDASSSHRPAGVQAPQPKPEPVAEPQRRPAPVQVPAQPFDAVADAIETAETLAALTGAWDTYGPDGDGTWTDEHTALAKARRALIESGLVAA